MCNESYVWCYHFGTMQRSFSFFSFSILLLSIFMLNSQHERAKNKTSSSPVKNVLKWLDCHSYWSSFIVLWFYLKSLKYVHKCKLYLWWWWHTLFLSPHSSCKFYWWFYPLTRFGICEPYTGGIEMCNDIFTAGVDSVFITANLDKNW